MRHALLAALLATLGCGSFTPAAFDDGAGGNGGNGGLVGGPGGAPDGGAGPGGASGQGGGGVGGAPGCTLGERWCDGEWVVSCEADGPDYVQDCASDGLCLQGACEAELVARWGFDEGAGGVAVDDVGALAATLEGAAAWSPGALDLGAGGHAALGDVLHQPFPLSLAGWVRVDSSASGTMAVVALDSNDASYAGVWLTVNPDAGNLLSSGFGDGSGTGPNDRFGMTSAAGFASGSWAHVAAVWHDSATVELYIDGQFAQGSSSGGAAALGYTAAEALIGTATWASADYQFQGEIDDVRIYARALTADDVARLAGGGQ